jgi:hypothetical protein
MAERLVLLTRKGSQAAKTGVASSTAADTAATVIDQISFELGDLFDLSHAKSVSAMSSNSSSESKSSRGGSDPKSAMADLEEELRSALIQLTATGPPVMRRLPDGKYAGETYSLALTTKILVVVCRFTSSL